MASQVVGVVTLLSGLLRLPPSLVGLTLLAWGNSLGDFFGNAAMARVSCLLTFYNLKLETEFGHQN